MGVGAGLMELADLTLYHWAHADPIWQWVGSIQWRVWRDHASWINIQGSIVSFHLRQEVLEMLNERETA